MSTKKETAGGSDLAERDRFLKAVHPDWDWGGMVHNWRNHVPEFIQEEWGSFTERQRILLAEWADELAGREEWD